MSKQLTIQDKDRERIEHLMKDFQIKKQIDVIRAGLDLLEKEAIRLKKIKRWKQAAKAVAENSKTVNKSFQKFSRLKRS
jgi:ATP-dependent Lon protease